MRNSEWRRFIPLKNTKELKNMMKEKGISHEDLALIFESLDISHIAFPEIVKSREVAQKSLCQNM